MTAADPHGPPSDRVQCGRDFAATLSLLFRQFSTFRPILFRSCHVGQQALLLALAAVYQLFSDLARMQASALNAHRAASVNPSARFARPVAVRVHRAAARAAHRLQPRSTASPAVETVPVTNGNGNGNGVAVKEGNAQALIKVRFSPTEKRRLGLCSLRKAYYVHSVLLDCLHQPCSSGRRRLAGCLGHNSSSSCSRWSQCGSVSTG